MTDIAKMLIERGNAYGDFAERARIAQALKRAMADCPNWASLPDGHSAGSVSPAGDSGVISLPAFCM